MKACVECAHAPSSLLLAGKPVHLHGSLGREAATGRGTVFAIRELLKATQSGRIQDHTFVIQVRAGDGGCREGVVSGGEGGRRWEGGAGHGGGGGGSRAHKIWQGKGGGGKGGGGRGNVYAIRELLKATQSVRIPLLCRWG